MSFPTPSSPRSMSRYRICDEVSWPDAIVALTSKVSARLSVVLNRSVVFMSWFLFPFLRKNRRAAAKNLSRQALLPVFADVARPDVSGCGASGRLARCLRISRLWFSGRKRLLAPQAGCLCYVVAMIRQRYRSSSSTSAGVATVPPTSSRRMAR